MRQEKKDGAHARTQGRQQRRATRKLSHGEHGVRIIRRRTTARQQEIHLPMTAVGGGGGGLEGRREGEKERKEKKRKEERVGKTDLRSYSIQAMILINPTLFHEKK